jgi:hypothetical protein
MEYWSIPYAEKIEGQAAPERVKGKMVCLPNYLLL